ncbi:S1C family serine protease [Aquisphaera giovannonii]|uniref:S1C family serine protease n=1 Tax=Aquisphaera giovannonii TaxID=406548 RepID=UPI00143DE49D|nr:trypsin-like peptidase domain-containing protein [Aquisphaera giovannonii]
MSIRGGGASGVIVDAERGLILTTEQAMGGSPRAVVVFTDGRQVETDRVYRDPRSELVLVGIKPQGLGLKAVTWTGSQPLEMGDWLLAVGRPTGRSHAISAGIVSGRGLVNTPRGDFEGLWTDAITGGANAGGPLVDLEGRVVAIGLNPVDGAGSPERFGLAIPAEAARRFISEVSDPGQVRRGYLGLTIGEERGDPLDAGVPRGLVITAVLPGSAAEQSGFRAGDRLLAVDGLPIGEVDGLSRVVEAAPVGTEFRLRVSREGKATELVVRSRPRPDGQGVAAIRPAVPPRTASPNRPATSPTRRAPSAAQDRDKAAPTRTPREMSITPDTPRQLDPIGDPPSGSASLPPDPDGSPATARTPSPRAGAAAEPRPTAEPGLPDPAELPEDSRPLPIPVEQPKPQTPRRPSPTAAAKPGANASPDAVEGTPPAAKPQPATPATTQPGRKPEDKAASRPGADDKAPPVRKPDDKPSPKPKPDAKPSAKPQDQPKSQEKPRPHEKPKTGDEPKPQEKPASQAPPDEKSSTPKSKQDARPESKPAPPPAPISEPVDLSPLDPPLEVSPAPGPGRAR